MKPHPRIRKTVKWGGMVATVLLVVVWFGSAWWSVNYLCAGWGIGAGYGDFGIVHLSSPLPSLSDGWYPSRVHPGFSFHWGFTLVLSPPARGFAIPLWALVLPALACTVIAIRLDTLARRRARMNVCPKCSYDRTGLARDAKCPECGTLKA